MLAKSQDRREGEIIGDGVVPAAVVGDSSVSVVAVMVSIA